jgi:hypothetical protein
MMALRKRDECCFSRRDVESRKPFERVCGNLRLIG